MAFMVTVGLVQRDGFGFKLIQLAAIALGLTAPLAAQSELDFPIESYEELNEPENMLVPPVDFDFKDAFAQIRDPAIETVDELSRNPAAGSGRTVAPDDEAFGRRIQNRWDRVQDPAITTVDQLTRDQGGKKDKKDEKKEKKKDEWYDKINIRGYTQFRINSLLWNNPDLANAYHPGDRSVAPLNHFFIRRCRIIFSGNLSEHLFFYIQPDFASNVPGAQDGAINYTQLRDCYGDVNLTTDKVHRVRVGLSKIPFGWDNMQSSSNRIPLDRSDAINTAINGERGTGVFYYWTPDYAQDLYKYVLDEGLKGSGNYGVFGIGCYNGQGVSRLDANNNMHFVIRLATPWKMDDGQIMEAGVQAYTGNYSPYLAPIKYDGETVTPVVVPENGVLDQRIATTFVYYPQPFGFQTEWTTGDGPRLSSLNGTSKNNPPEITSKPISGGYAMVNYKIDSERWGVMFPFFRWQTYRGGYLWERNSPDSYVGEFNLGMEWQFSPQMELTAEYDWVNRTNTSSTQGLIRNGEFAQFQGDLLRFQFQINY
jgi:hypothetical protein